MKTEKIFFKSGEHELAGLIDLPDNLPAPAVILCHGYTNTKDDCPLFKDLTQLLRKEGFIVFRFDQFGSGESPGLFKDKLTSILVQNAKDTLAFLSQDKRILKIGMLGISTGGAILTCMAGDSRIKATVMISPSYNLVREFKRERDQLDEDGFAPLACDPQTGQTASGRTKGPLVISRAFFDELPSMDELARKTLPEMKNVLILFGADDKLVSPGCGIEIYKMVREPKELHLIWNAGHNCKKKPEETVDLAVKWFEKWLK